jgi:diguanylate cyclase (GGDEF)-like protein
MQSWEEAFEELRVQFFREAGPRLDEIERLLDLLAREPADADALRGLMRAFHGFAGSGLTYGLPQLTAHGLSGELSCSEVLSGGAAPRADALTDWRGLLESMRAALPAASGEKVPAPVSAPLVPPRRTADILVVEDDPAMRSFLMRRIEREGLAARGAATMADAMRAVEQRLPAGLIVDIGLPDGSGYELVEAVRARAGGDAPAVMIVSVLADFPDKVAAVHCGADGFFEKPVDWEVLMRRLVHLLDRNRAEPPRVLAVEDDARQASFLRIVLASAGYAVRVCDDPRRFEADMISFRPDLVLMDIVLPGIRGYDLARYLRQDERYATLPILFLATDGQVEARIQTARAGGDDHMTKPIDPALLLAAVGTRIERARFLKSLLDRDGLTRLLNQTTFLERAAAVLSRRRRDRDRTTAWVMIDMDHFKSVNDRYGHPAGDRVLSALATLLRRRLRQSDIVGRYGGEEFAVLLDDLTEPDALRLMRRLLAEFTAQSHQAPDGSPFHATFSAGIAMLDPAAMDLNGWRQAADTALYAAKAAGRNQVSVAPTPGTSGLPQRETEST